MTLGRAGGMQFVMTLPSSRSLLCVRRLGARLAAACWILVLGLQSPMAGPSPVADTASRPTAFARRAENLLHGQVRAYAVSLLDPHSGLRVRVNADRPFHAASTMKIGVLLALYRRAQRGQESLSRRVTIRNSFRSVADGSRFSVPAENSEDCACLTYKSRRRSQPLRLVAKDMIQSSSNLATNVLIQRLGTPAIRLELARMGLSGIRVVRGLYDMKAYDQEIHNVLTADATMRAFDVLRRPEFLSWKYRGEMLQLLAATEHRDKIPALIPASTIVAQKSGYTDDVSHDAGLIFPEPNRPYALAILTEGHRDKYVLEERVARLSREAFDMVVLARREKSR